MPSTQSNSYLTSNRNVFTLSFSSASSPRDTRGRYPGTVLISSLCTVYVAPLYGHTIKA